MPHSQSSRVAFSGTGFSREEAHRFCGTGFSREEARMNTLDLRCQTWRLPG